MSSIGNNYTPFYVTDADLGPELLKKSTLLGYLPGVNRVINGGMDIDQRNEGSSTTAQGYCVDRWVFGSTTGTCTAQRTGTPGSYALTVSTTSAVTGLNVYQRIEAANVADLAGKTVTLSFTASSNSVTSLPWSVGYASAVDNFSTATPFASGTLAVTPTPGRYSVSFVAHANVTNGMYINLVNSLSVGSGVSISLTNVQLEEGSVASPYGRRSIGYTLLECERYYSKSYANGTKPGDITFAGAVGSIGRMHRPSVFFRTTMRAAPSVTIYQPNTGVAGSVYNSGTSVVVAIAEASTSGYVLNGPVQSGVDSDLRWQWTASSEL